MPALQKILESILKTKRLKCAWCKNTFPEQYSEKHKERCPHYKPVPTVTGIDKTGGVNKKKKVS